MMAEGIQLTFFPESKEEKLEKKVVETQEYCKKSIRSAFAKITKLEHENKYLLEQLDFLITNICKGNYELIK
jgi:hypothetical protein